MPTLHVARLKEKADEKGDETTYAIARRLKLRQSTVARLMARETTPSVPTLCLIRAAYGISLDDLVDESTTAQPRPRPTRKRTTRKADPS